VIGALAWLQVLATFQHLLRCVLTVLFPPAEPLHLDPIQAAYSYLNLTLSLASGVGLIGLAFLIHRNDLYSRANTDSLTGLLNRQAFDEILIRELRRLDSESLPVTVVMADIDFFKRVNDVQGHLAGDVVLRQVSRALSRTLRPSDAISRFGGEEFAMVLRETSLPRAVEVAERLRAAVAALSRLPGGIRVTISLGVAAGISAEPSQELIRRSDEALYRSKREGRNRVSVAAEIGGDSAPDPPAPRLALNGEAQRPA
jgi:diguanylate cyclase (GGDEF)-like protein